MLAAKDSKPSASSENTTPGEEESMTPAPQPSRLGELAAPVVPETSRGPGTVQRVQVSSLARADKPKESQDKSIQKSSPTLATSPKKVCLGVVGGN